MEYHDERGGLWFSDDRDRRRDLCNRCYNAVDEYIDELYRESINETVTEENETIDKKDRDLSLKFKKVSQK
ncbi:MAG TPA: hypothetical protein VF220_01540 [Nitrososphaeraceae archaeon]